MRKSFKKKKKHTLTKDPFSLLKQRRKRRTKKKSLAKNTNIATPDTNQPTILMD
jgi:hypothetical protein